MYSNKKAFKLNKTKTQQKNGSSQQQQNLSRVQERFSSKSQLGDRSSVVDNNNDSDVSIHKVWPDLQLNQSHLFFECTLFLYSVLALFLQYLNLYRTLWWLPKSYWHYSLKYHLINPYLLSCIGLLLGFRVTKCFWDTISERVDFFAKGQDGWQLTFWKIFEYAIVKTPLSTIVTTSFLFSFTRIYAEFGVVAISCFICPFALYVFIFQRAAICRKLDPFFPISVFPRSVTARFLPLQNELTKNSAAQSQVESDLTVTTPQKLIELDSYVHTCKATAGQLREETAFLLKDFELRCKHCVYTGLLTAFFAIFMPRAFLPRRTVSGAQQVMLLDDIWIVQLFSIVCLTACSLYITYLFPINYFDLLYRSAVHLGCWEAVQPEEQQTNSISFQHPQRIGSGRMQNEQQNQHNNEHFELYNETRPLPYHDGTRLVFNQQVYIARSHPHHRTVCAEPGNEQHLRLYRLAKDPVLLVSYLCCFQVALVAFEFWLLLLTSDWQQIVTLVLLMFANYLLLAKMFKDRVVIGRVYNPSDEDLQLIKQLQEETERARKEAERQEKQQKIQNPKK